LFVRCGCDFLNSVRGRQLNTATNLSPKVLLPDVWWHFADDGGSPTCWATCWAQRAEGYETGSLRLVFIGVSALILKPGLAFLRQPRRPVAPTCQTQVRLASAPVNRGRQLAQHSSAIRASSDQLSLSWHSRLVPGLFTRAVMGRGGFDQIGPAGATPRWPAKKRLGHIVGLSRFARRSGGRQACAQYVFFAGVLTQQDMNRTADSGA
jgi:hypothetical protein